MIRNLRLFNAFLLAPSALSLETSRHSHSYRRVLGSSDNIGQTVRELRANGERALFTFSPDIEEGSIGHGTNGFLELDVAEATNSAVTFDTVFIDIDKTMFPVGNSTLQTLLISDISTNKGAETFAILAIDEYDNVRGIVEPKGKKAYTISQSPETNQGKILAIQDDNVVAPEWSCGMHEHEDIFDRRLDEEKHQHYEHHHNEHHHHKHGHTISAMEHLSRSLRGTKINQIDNSRRLEANVDYNYQVNLYIEIDQAFVQNSGGSITTAINYVNTMVTAANVVYEKEIMTHLHVSYIVLTNAYDNATNPREALMLMQSLHGKDDSWHHQGINLHHGLFGAKWYGGLAWIGVLCRSDFGFGVTSSIAGNFEKLDYTAIWDLYGFLHEMGHQLGSGHTEDERYYSPMIDNCQNSCPSTADESATRWSTIMGNCKRCPGQYDNVMYSFGGQYSGDGDKSNISNWIDNPDLVSNYDEYHFSTDPRREAHKMYSHVSTRGSCAAIPQKPASDNETTTQTTVSSPPTSSSTTSSTTSSPITTTSTKLQTTQSPATSTGETSTRATKAAKLAKRVA